ncbi:MAG: DUF3488 and transglutaminase-like domain-containing protein [Pseudomonadota bacterium]
MGSKKINNDVRNLNLDRVIHWILLAQLLSLLPLFQLVPIWIVAACLGVGFWRLAVNRYQLALPSRLITFCIGVLAAYLIYTTYGTLVSREAGVSLIVLMFSLKLLEMRQFRDAILILFLSYFLLVVNFLYYEHVLMVIYLFATVFVITLALVILNSSDISVGYKKLLSMAGTLFTLSIPVCVLLFIFFPRLAHPLWQMPGNSTGTTGFSETMSPGTISELFESDDIVFRVKIKSEEIKPDSSQLYWRGIVLSNYDGLTWRKSTTRAIGAPDIVRRSSPIEYSVILEPHNKKWLFSLDIPDYSNSYIVLYNDFSMESERNIRSVFSYQLKSYLDYRYGLNLNPIERQINLQLPNNFNPEMVRWSVSRRQTVNTDADFVQNILNYITQNQFFYTVTPPVYEENIVDDFWFGEKRGYCEHYSNAFVYIMRAAGIPARVVTGYSGGEYNPYGDYLIVRAKDAHAWTEIWLPNQGWIRVDPTAAIHPSRVEPMLAARMEQRTAMDRFVDGEDIDSYISDISSLRAIQLTLDAFNHAWNEWFLGFDQDKQMQLFELMGFDFLSPRDLLPWMITLLIILVAAIGLVILRQKDNGDPLARALMRLSKKLSHKGLAWSKHEAPLTFFERLKTHYPQYKADITDIQRRYSSLRYQESRASQNMPLLVKKINTLKSNL